MGGGQQMRRDFHPLLLDAMRKDPNIYVLTGDLGYGMFDEIQKEFPDRFINCGAREQLMLGMAVGLSMSGKIPVVYSITPFLLWRGAEWIRNYIDHERWNVKLVGGGRGRDYAHDGFTHYAGDDKDMLRMFKNIPNFWPKDTDEMKTMFDLFINSDTPVYMNLKR